MENGSKEGDTKMNDKKLALHTAARDAYAATAADARDASDAADARDAYAREGE